MMASRKSRPGSDSVLRSSPESGWRTTPVTVPTIWRCTSVVTSMLLDGEADAVSVARLFGNTGVTKTGTTFALTLNGLHQSGAAIECGICGVVQNSPALGLRRADAGPPLPPHVHAPAAARRARLVNVGPVSNLGPRSGPVPRTPRTAHNRRRGRREGERTASAG